METTTLTYSNNFYNNLTDIHEAHTWAMTEKSQKILDSMMEINKLNVFGVCRLHKHFILKENECVVTSKTPEGYLAQVKPYSAKFYPWIWRFVAEQSAWVPTEFFEVPEAQISEVEDGVLMQTPPSVVCKFVEEYLKNLGDASYSFEHLGLCIDICKFFDEKVPAD